MVNNYRIFYLIFIFDLISYKTTFSQEDWHGEIINQNGILHIVNAEEPIYKLPNIFIEKVWETGGEDPGFIFNNITAIDIDKKGRVYVADVLEKNIKVFSPSGEYLFTFGRQGQGPGEYQIPKCLTLLPNQQILVIDVGGGLFARFKFFDCEGNYINEFMVELKNSINLKDDENSRAYLLSLGMISFSKLFSENRLLLIKDSIEEMKYQVHSLWIFVLDKRQGIKIIENKKIDPQFTNQLNQSDRDFLDTQWCHDNKGNIYFIKDIFDYTIDVYDKQGNLKKVIKRVFNFPLKTKDEYEKDRERMNKYVEQQKGYGITVKWEELKYRSIIFNPFHITRSMFCDDQNRLWILTNESFSPHESKGLFSWFSDKKSQHLEEKGTRFTFDVFDEEGKFLMKIPFDAEQPRCFVYKNGSLYFAALKEDGFPWLFKYRIIETKQEELNQ